MIPATRVEEMMSANLDLEYLHTLKQVRHDNENIPYHRSHIHALPSTCVPRSIVCCIHSKNVAEFHNAILPWEPKDPHRRNYKLHHMAAHYTCVYYSKSVHGYSKNDCT